MYELLFAAITSKISNLPDALNIKSFCGLTTTNVVLLPSVKYFETRALSVNSILK